MIVERINITVECDPPRSTSQGSSTILKNRKTGSYFIGKPSNSPVKTAKEYIRRLFIEHAPHTKLEHPLIVEIMWVYPYLKSEPKKNRGKLIPCVKRPDIDNLFKMFGDTITDLKYWKDDAQVFSLKFDKYYGDPSRIELRISEYLAD